MEQYALEIVLTRITEFEDRNSCSLVCRVFRAAERQTRRHLRLRCTRSSLEQAPTCFPEVCSLDLSSVVPRSVEFNWSPSQLQRLGACFPNVQTLTLFNDGCHDWVNSGDIPFLETWPQLRTIIIQEPEPCITKYDNVSRAWPALWGAQVGGRPLVLSVSHPGPGIILKEVSSFKVGIAELRAFMEGSSVGLEKLAVELASELPASLDLDLSSLSGLPSLRELSLESSGCFLASIQNPSEPFSSLTSLSLQSPMSMTHSLIRILVTATVAKRLQILRLDWTPSSKMEFQQNNDLLALHHCNALEHFELKKGRQLFGNCLLETILSIVNGAPRLTVLRLHGFQHLNDLELHNRNILCDRLGMRELVEVDTDFSVADPDHMPLKGKLVQKYGCKLQPSPGSWCLVAGWDTLQDLTLNVEMGDMWLTIECPSLRKLKLMMSPRVNQLRFVGPHTTLVEVDLKMHKGGEPRMSREVAHMVAVLESLQKLGNLTRLSLTASPFSMMRWGSSVTKPIAALQALEKLVIHMTEALEEVRRTSFVQSLIELQHSKCLVEVQVPFGWDPTLSEFYARLYGH